MSSYTHKQGKSQRSKKDLNQRTLNFNNQKNWIGMDTAPGTFPETPDHRPKQSYRELKSEHRYIQAKPVQPFQGNVGHHTHHAYTSKKNPAELMQDILRVVQDTQQNSLYYSKDAEENLCQLLTNRFKLNSYLQHLQSDMPTLDTPTTKNYQILGLLLQQLSHADVEVMQSEEGMELRFNRGVTERQESEIERLQKEKEEKEKQMKYVVEEYQAIIYNFNDVIQKLVNKEEGKYRGKY